MQIRFVRTRDGQVKLQYLASDKWMDVPLVDEYGERLTGYVVRFKAMDHVQPGE